MQKEKNKNHSNKTFHFRNVILRSQLHFQAKQLSFFSPRRHWSLDMSSLASRSLLMRYLMWQMSLPRQHGQMGVFLLLHSLPHFFQFVINLFFPSIFMYFSSHTSFATVPSHFRAILQDFLVCTYCHILARYTDTQDRKPGGQMILLWQTVSWVTCRKEWRGMTFKQTVAALALARTNLLSHMYAYDVQTHISDMFVSDR